MSNVYSTNYSVGEEIAHTITHGIGALLSVAGLAVLVSFASLNGDAWHIVSSSIYGATLIILYSASSLYHGISHPKAKALLQQFDHAAIYLLIAGTYTPFLLVSLRGVWGWSLFGVIWSIAIVGMIFEFVDAKRFKKLSLWLYLGLGWIVVLAIKPMLAQVEMGGLILLLLGGLSYSLGVIFYVREQMAYHHAIWHLFVLAGSVFHFFSVLFYVIP
ncbi:MAG: hemolysin III family protein [Gammaproteobacteria bacterium]|jgi:hemolysin III|nr:hemolysin III family protein [Gammaproteobacteria bacterium]MBT3723486.1 hemolysin III family protein [Gammaproteobacteria bacterium]MBT4076572.1 hemolysin III family protein [Gammaproteobacteria bacterium]MBT4194306.1 hemolysin III family protein [Gammaproteobacteria bacterium]MBT4450860.1 hemolysin III family protein [Gammaproteobacteria bacterium]